MEQLHVHVEVWPLAADDAGIWLLSGLDAWRSGPVPHDLSPRDEVDHVLAEKDLQSSLDLIHSTSWRAELGHILLTYIAVVHTDRLVRDRWPTATPVSPALADAVGKPTPTEATGEPAPRYIDVLMHGIRHLRFLELTDSPARKALRRSPAWRTHLEAWAPALSGMYEEQDARANLAPDSLSRAIIENT